MTIAENIAYAKPGAPLADVRGAARLANAEGFKGLEHGIKTGVPYFSVCKYNRDVIIGMTEKCQSVTQSYARNFLSKLVPLGGYTKPYLYQRLHHMMTAQEKPHDHGWLQWDAYVYDAGHVQ